MSLSYSLKHCSLGKGRDNSISVIFNETSDFIMPILQKMIKSVFISYIGSIPKLLKIVSIQSYKYIDF